MARLVIQSLATGKFLCPDEDGQPDWFVSLKTAGCGVFTEFERAAQLIEDWCDSEDQPQLIDLDRLGTPNDYVKGV